MQNIHYSDKIHYYNANVKGKKQITSFFTTPLQSQKNREAAVLSNFV